MRVLLVSPLPKLDPACGDVTYTETLLAHPPGGVAFETYSQALARGTLREHGTGRALRAALHERRGVVGEVGRTAFHKSVNALRKRRALFWEPFRCFSVKAGEYDLVHVHVFSARFLHLPCPLVVSNAAPVRSLYRDARRYSAVRFGLMEAAERALGWAAGINVVSYRLPQVTRVIAFTEYLRQWYVGRGIVPPDRADVVPIYLPPVSATGDGLTAARKPVRVGFVAKDFDAKGGEVLLKAFARVRAVRVDAELVIVGCPPRMDEAEAARRGIRWIPYIARERLLAEVLPSFDVFAYPTQFDGMPLVVLEALSMGIPVATSDYQAMPELVDHGRAGLVSMVNDDAELASNVLRLLQPEVNGHYRAAASDWFERKFSADAVRPKLLQSYQRAIDAWGDPSSAGARGKVA